jgi:hypothetical protein
MDQPMSVDASDSIGTRAEPTEVHKEGTYREGLNRRRELFPQRYDNRPLWMRALERVRDGEP